jgi:hypothetical protein
MTPIVETHDEPKRKRAIGIVQNLKQTQKIAGERDETDPLTFLLAANLELNGPFLRISLEK